MTAEGVVFTPPRNEIEREIARCIAMGYSFSETAQLARCSESTVARALRVLRPYVDAIRERVADDFQSSLYSNLALAVDIERRFLTGELDAKDPRYQEAKVIVRAVRDRLFHVAPSEPPPPRAAPPEPPAALITAPTVTAAEPDSDAGEPGASPPSA